VPMPDRLTGHTARLDIPGESAGGMNGIAE